MLNCLHVGLKEIEKGEPGHRFKGMVQGKVNLDLLALVCLIDCSDER